MSVDVAYFYPAIEQETGLPSKSLLGVKTVFELAYAKPLCFGCGSLEYVRPLWYTPEERSLWNCLDCGCILEVILLPENGYGFSPQFIKTPGPFTADRGLL